MTRPPIGPEIMIAEWLFVETLEDLRRRCEKPRERSRYELLGIAPLLRKLFVDGHTLVDRVRAGRPEIQMDFRLRPWTKPESVGDDDLPYLIRLGGEELVGDQSTPSITTIQHLLKAQVGMVRDRPLALRDVVLYYANAEGGVHLGPAKNDTQEVLSSMAPLLLGHSNGQIEILAHIGRVATDGLSALYESVLSSPMRDTRMHLRNEHGFFENHWTTDRYRAQLGL
ncbi:hypothetical protein [Leucobacter massiliensis]|uniref:Uncharacterized protein n=1 Tax=Leucobacter massiliensis TaxID=1686285 RepID=A0A2S9QLN9_9MICO|nr:hypothetical protein [Leucobacter massiliensis]PRI10508.1 hypothetical protein B4915_10910 [Leucobacter massiliensis]